jgi:hypothetical protein
MRRSNLLRRVKLRRAQAGAAAVTVLSALSDSRKLG